MTGSPAQRSAPVAGTSWADDDPDWEYVPLRLPAEVTRFSAAVQLSLHAEYGGWELARVLRYDDGTRRIWLRRKRRPAPDALPLPGLSL